jgi:protein arginine kinase activator
MKYMRMPDMNMCVQVSVNHIPAVCKRGCFDAMQGGWPDMKCQMCHKNEANIIFTQIINGDKIVLQICGDCARQKGISIDIEKPTQPKKLMSLLGNLASEQNEQSEESVPDMTCEQCGLTFAEFKKEGLFGCEHCHIAFGNAIQGLLKQIHGTDIHTGKLPGAMSIEGRSVHELSSLRKELRQCIETEDYERAAELRDRIAAIEEKKVTR